MAIRCYWILFDTYIDHFEFRLFRGDLKMTNQQKLKNEDNVNRQLPVCNKKQMLKV